MTYGDASRFLVDAYGGVTSLPGKGIPHAQAVAEILRENGSGDDAQMVGLLHDVREDTPRTVDDIRAAFGDDVAEKVAALSEDRSVTHYAPRKRQLRAAIAASGSPVVDVSLADKIASLRYAAETGTPVSGRKLAHYRATLKLARAAAVAPALCDQLDALLDEVSHQVAPA
jgi:(p)ppGpp synthase/HD superfamily hydrolase